MVATAGAGWRLAPSLVALVDETDELYPNRDHSSDGSVGDAAHSARVSDHNPSGGWVCAVDLDEDLSAGVHTLARLAAHLIDLRDHRVKYLIYEGRICKSYIDSARNPAWQWQTYTGLNDHTHHLHVSVWNTEDARDDTGPWWPQEDDMSAQAEKQIAEIHRKIGAQRAIGTDDGEISGNALARLDVVWEKVKRIEKMLETLIARG